MLLFNVVCSHAQDSSDTIKYPYLEPILCLQTWADYTYGLEKFTYMNTGYYIPVDNRISFQLRRSRFGIAGALNERLTFKLIGAYDYIGRDDYSSTVGGDEAAKLKIWNGSVQYRLTKRTDILNITIGYFLPQISRESITDAFHVSSFEKAGSQRYLRRFTVNNETGRSIGINLGGLIPDINENLSLTYNVGVFNGIRYDGPDILNAKKDPLFTGRIAIHLGDPEFTSYSLDRKVNYQGERNGITVALSGSYEGFAQIFDFNRTYSFDNSYTYGLDILYNLGHLHLSGEWSKLVRFKEEHNGMQLRSTCYTGFIRLGYNIESNVGIWEPTITFAYMNGEKDDREQSYALELHTFFGEESYWDLSLNYYLNEHFKFTINATFRSGNVGTGLDWFFLGNDFYYGNKLYIKRGNMIAIGSVFTL